MIKSLILSSLTLILAFNSVAQKKNKKFELNLTNALVIGQFDQPEDRYLVEISLTQLLSSRQVKASPSLNVLKLGEDIHNLTGDSLTNVIKNSGIDTYVLVSVRGYDRRYKPSETLPTLTEALSGANLFGLFQEDIVSISFDFKFFRNGTCVYNDIVKCGNVGDRESVIKRFQKKIGKRILKRWK